MSEVKRCSRCKLECDRSNFLRASKRADGLHPWCKNCWREWRSKNFEKRRALEASYYEANKEKVKEARRARYKASPVVPRSMQSEWRKNNPGKAAAHIAAYKSRKRNAMPVWADRDMIEWLYELAQRRSDETGVQHHVDHIIPLAGRRACGLHVPANLRIIPASENASKGAREVNECGVEWL